MVNYSNTGVSIIGTGLISYEYGNYSDSKYDDAEPSVDRRSDPFAGKITKWEETTIGEIMERSIIIYRKKGGTITNFKLVVAQELAFFVLNQVSRVTHDTPCRLGFAPRTRAIRIGDTEYRSSGYKLHQRKVSA